MIGVLLMATLICLANSIRHDGRCVAGIDVQTGEWVRPVPSGGGGIPYSTTCVAGRPVGNLEVVRIPLTTTNPSTRYQRENRVMRDAPWTLIRQATIDEVMQYCDGAAPILHTDSDRVAPDDLDRLPARRWTSLQLVHAEHVAFHRDHFSPKRWRAHFADSAGSPYSLKVTDPIFTARLDRNESVGEEYLLTVSLTEPWAFDSNSAPMCWKLVAAVIELDT